MIKLIGETHIDFIGKRKIAFSISGLLALLGLFAAVQIGLGHGNMAIEFTGGTMVQGAFARPVSTGDLRNILAGGGFTDAEIKALVGRETPNSFMIRVKEDATGQTQSAQRLVALLAEKMPDNSFTVDSMHEVGPSVGQILQRQARNAIFIALGCILIYIWLRFDFRSGVAATIATFHDVLVVLGILFILNREISLLVISGLLTLAGYSLTDTVVVFDRIRENLKQYRRRSDFGTTINNSINEVLSRTIITTLTTQIVVVILMFFGGEVLFDFSLTLFLGFLVGTYSSWFVASPIVVEWEERRPSRFK
jgi:preprotein translocase subunit SecF